MALTFKPIDFEKISRTIKIKLKRVNKANSGPSLASCMRGDTEKNYDLVSNAKRRRL